MGWLGSITNSVQASRIQDHAMRKSWIVCDRRFSAQIFCQICFLICTLPPLLIAKLIGFGPLWNEISDLGPNCYVISLIFSFCALQIFCENQIWPPFSATAVRTYAGFLIAWWRPRNNCHTLLSLAMAIPGSATAVTDHPINAFITLWQGADSTTPRLVGVWVTLQTHSGRALVH